MELRSPQGGRVDKFPPLMTFSLVVNSSEWDNQSQEDPRVHHKTQTA